MSRPRKRKLPKVDRRTPLDEPPPDYSDPAERKRLQDTLKELAGIEIPDDAPCFDPPADPAAYQEENKALAAGARQLTINTLRVDPKGDDPLALVLGSVILDRSFPSGDEVAGKMFVSILKNPDPMVARRFFQRVMRLKLNAASPHRNAYAFHAYGRFIEETGREPSKAELRAYIEARRDEFRDAPAAEDGKGWTRVWKESGLSDLAPK